MAVKLSRLDRSQEAHRRLRRKAESIPGKKGEIKYHYHNEMLIRQRGFNRILNRKERKNVFKWVSNHFSK